MTQLKKIITASMIAILSFSLVSCASTSTSESTGQYLDNSAVTTKVKAQLFNHLGSQGFDIKVKTYKNNVQLSGFVNSQMVKHRAETIARSVEGVGRVTNNIIVKG